MLLHFSSKARLAIANAGEQSPRLLQANPTFPTFIDASALHLLPLHLTASVKPSTPFGFLFFPSDKPDPPLFVTFPLFLISRISPQGGENRETLFRFQFLFLLAITTPQSLVILAFLLLAST